MKVSELVYSLKRPVDLIEIDTSENQRYLYDGYDNEESIPLQILEMPVMNWEVSVMMKIESMCEIETVFTLTIKTGDIV